MGIPVKLQVFEGPLDLLLHLIDKNKIDIYDIPIVEITNQYLDYIKQMQEEDLNVMSEFMVMSATLISIKCKMLLPKEVDEEGVEEDPRSELVQQLLEYKMYKYMSYELRERMKEAVRSLYKSQSLPKEVLAYKPPVDTKGLLDQITLGKLQKVFQDVMKREENKIDPIRSKFGKIQQEEVSLPEKINFVLAYGKLHKKYSFRKLLAKQAGKVQIVVTFLAILELMKSGAIKIIQEDIFGEILIEVIDEVRVS